MTLTELQNGYAQRYIAYKLFTENIGTIEAIYSGSLPENISGGEFITAPDPEKKDYPNLRPVLRIKLDTKELFYDYESDNTLEMRVLTVNSEVSTLKANNEAILQDVSSINTDITDTQIAVTESYETTLKVEEDTTKTQIAVTEVYEELLKTQAALSTANLAIQALQTEITKLKGE